jgi:prefoldin alpha subunit
MAGAARLEQLERTLTDRLQPDYARATQTLEAVAREVAEFEALRSSLQRLLTHPAAPLETQVDLGMGFFAAAVVPDPRTVLVDIGLGFHAEFTLPEAVAFCGEKLRRLAAQQERLFAATGQLGARIKLVATGVDDLRRLVAAAAPQS